jgi:hypothetical protein
MTNIFTSEKRLKKQAAYQAAIRDVTAKTQWAIETDAETRDLGIRHPSAEAVMYVREALSEYNVPSMKLQYTGIKRMGERTDLDIREGDSVIMVQAELKSLSGIRQYIDVPVLVNAGKMLRPEVFMHDGEIKVMAQSSIDDLMGKGNIERGTYGHSMFAAPGQPAQLPPTTVTQGDWTSMPKHGQLDATDAYLDPAERDRSEYCQPGYAFKTKNELALKTRGGATIHVPARTAGTVIRDMTGDGTVLYVDLDGFGPAPVKSSDIS